MSSAQTGTQSGGPQSESFLGAGQQRAPTIRSTPGSSPYANPIINADDRAMTTTQQVTRLAARLNASTVSDKERDAFLAERAALLSKQLGGGLTRKEIARLDYVRWSLDRIEDAKHGPVLDRLDAHIDEIKRLAARLTGLRDNLDRGKRR